MTCQVFEETGPVVSSRGTTLTEITNFNWKRTADVTFPYYQYPLKRPEAVYDQTLSYKKYVFFKITGTFTYIKNILLEMSVVIDDQAHKTDLFYKWSNTYAVPEMTYDGSMIMSSGEIWRPALSATGPHVAGTWEKSRTGALTLYTPYLITQLRVNNSTWNDAGNSKKFLFNFHFDEFE